MDKQLISDEYRELNRELHQRNDNFGKRGSDFVETLVPLCAEYETTDVLDYGCGKGELNLHTPFAIKMYDPAVRKHEDLPEPADIVACLDVMEHVEPEHIDDVLSHVESLTKKAAIFGIALIPAKKTLADGRNAHISLYPQEWWLEKLKEHFTIVKHQMLDAGEMKDVYLAAHVVPK